MNLENLQFDEEITLSFHGIPEDTLEMDMQLDELLHGNEWEDIEDKIIDILEVGK